MAKYELELKSTQTDLHNIIEDIAFQIQSELRLASGKPVLVLINKAVMNTCIDMACASIDYHGIHDDDISNEKKFAHICFWMIKLVPISYIIMKKSTGLNLVRGVLKPKKHDLLELEELDPHCPVNTEVSYNTFISLYCANRYKGEALNLAMEKILTSKYAKEVIKSLRFHNHSARGMAMFLETTIMEKLA